MPKEQEKNQFMPDKNEILGKIDKPFRLLLSAQSGSGKSRLIEQMLTDDSWGLSGRKFKLPNIYIISPTLEFDQAYHNIINHLESINNHKDKNGEPIYFDKTKQVFSKDPDRALQQIYEDIFEKQGGKKRTQMEKSKKKSVKFQDDDSSSSLDDDDFQETLLVLDDLMNEIDFGPYSYLTKMLCKCRHIGLSIILSVQNLKSVCPAARNQISHIISFQNSNQHEQKKLYEETGGSLKPKQFEQILNFCHSEPFAYILIANSFPQKYRFFKGKGSDIQQLEV